MMPRLDYFRCFLVFLVFTLGVGNSYGQNGFRFPIDQNRDRLSFQLLNNLVVIPVVVNDKELNFILDTGAKQTLLFSLSEIDSLEIRNVSPIKIRGLGTGGTIDALKSTGNTISVGDAFDKNHTIYVIFDESINFSPRMGIPIHGVLGYEFFKAFIVKTDYSSESLSFYSPKTYKYRKCKKCEVLPLSFKDDKPYIRPQIDHDGVEEEVLLLLDSGSSDALWLFEEEWVVKESPKNYFEDFLGYGISGGIFGKRSKIQNFSIGDFRFNRITVSFPEPEAVEKIVSYDERDGSLGAELLKRFTVIMDYPNQKVTFKKNRFYDDPFHYNMAGIVIEHDGAVTVNSILDNQSNFHLDGENDTATDKIEIPVNPILNFFLAPRYVVAEVRTDSPAALADIQKGDEVLSINGKPAYKFKLSEITELFSSKENRTIHLEIERNGKVMKRKFILKEVI